MNEKIKNDLEKLSYSKFRSRFHLSKKDFEYYLKNQEKMRHHTEDFLRKRIGCYDPFKDGKQTPFRGHPTFTAQHATATCCRGCIEKWYGIAKEKPLKEEDIEFFTNLILAWLEKEKKKIEE